jgi:dTDP-4-amino-4,6-dideoxygalactose transaminase
LKRDSFRDRLAIEERLGLDEWTRLRRTAADRYRELGLGDLVQVPEDEPGHVYHLFVIRTPARDALQAALAAEGIQTAIHYPTPIHLQPAYVACGAGPGSLPRTETAVAEILSLPMHPFITRDEVDEVCNAIRRFEAARASR